MLLLPHEAWAKTLDYLGAGEVAERRRNRTAQSIPSVAAVVKRWKRPPALMPAGLRQRCRPRCSRDVLRLRGLPSLLVERRIFDQLAVGFEVGQY